ncbi:2-dehydropantoate 2-reductase N-terminal domain-containing protein [Streptomyces marokkonensis]|uniref:2-dehydropantoate 2-reductase N-terminal domain-containing protein n=1 Tax=Streptomyces marokkonensis TaxID=324855 RepID=A0ABP7R7T7_9ACTN
MLALGPTGTFAHGLNGALTAVRTARLDVVGVAVLGVITALGGGFVRDVLTLSTLPVTLLERMIRTSTREYGMRYIIIGAGAVGGSIGGRLHESGHEVVLVARGEHYRALRENGLRFVTPQGARDLQIPVVDGPEAVELRADDVLILAVKTQDCVAALDIWAAQPVTGGLVAGERLPLFCAQNGVEGERLALRRFRRVYGMCVLLPSTYLEAGVIAAPCAPYTGALTLGRYPAGAADELVRSVADDLEKSALLAPVVPDVMRWKYAKLLGNLANAVDAVCGPGSGEAGQALVERAVAEATAVLDAAGTDRASTQEQRALRDGNVDVQPLEGMARGGGSSWQSLVRGTGSIEVDYLNGEIVLLGRLHSVPTPVNGMLQRVANACARERRMPGSLTAAELTALVDAD